MTKTGAGTWVLGGNASSYTGNTIIQGGTLSVGLLAAGGTNSSIGAASGANATIHIGSTTTGATLRYIGSTNSSTNRQIDLAGTTGGATLDASGTGTVTFSNTAVTATGLGAKNLTLTGSNTGNNTLSGNIVNSTGTGNLTNVTKTGAGTWVLSGAASTYTGNTIIQGGTLSVGTLANGGNNSSIGAASGANATIHIGNTTTGATLQYTGSGASTNRQIDLAGTTGGATLDASGTGNIIFANTTVTATGVGAKSLTLTGSNTGNNTLSGNIVDSSSGATSLTKTGAGTWVLGGNSTYTGGTTIGNGTLTSNSTNALGNLANVTLSAASATLGVGVSQTLSALNGTTGNVTLGANTLTVGSTDNLSSSFGGIISGTGGSLIKAGTGTMTLTSTNTFTGGITVNNGILLGTTASGGGTLDAGGFKAFGNYSGLVTPTNVITVNTGGTLAVQNSDLTYNSNGYGNTTTQQTLVLNGTGYNNNGALRSLGGVSTWTGNISLGSNTTITNAAVSGWNDTLYLGSAVNSPTPPPLTMAMNGHNLTFNGTGDVYITESMGNSGGDTGSLTINGATNTSTVYLQGIKNYFTGNTAVNQGVLYLVVNPGGYPGNITTSNSAILGNLTIGSGSLTGSTATVTTFYNEQISDTATVTINSDGTLDLGTNGTTETLGHLILNSGTVSTGTGSLLLGNVVSGNNIDVTGNATISGVLNLNNTLTGAPDRIISVASSANVMVSANVFGGNFIKDGTGTMTMTFNNAANGYTGHTEVKNGILNIQNSGALGATASGLVAAGTSVDSGATLQLQVGSYGNVTVGPEALNLSGTGYSNKGALESVSGNNTWGGPITLGNSSTINTDSGSNFSITSTVTGTATSSTTQILTAGGLGNTTYASTIADGSGGGTLALTKADAGTVTLTGSNTFTGAINVNAGTLVLGANDTLYAHTNAVTIASGATLSATGGSSGTPYTNTIGALNSASSTPDTGTISISTYNKVVLNVGPSPATNTFSGLITGSGTFELNASSTSTGTLTLTNSTTSFAGLMQVDRGTLAFNSTASGSTFTNLTVGNLLTTTTLLLNNANINVGTLTITGNTILDFGTSGASILNCTNIYIAAGYTLTVLNWNSEVDFLYARTAFGQISGSGATPNAIGAAPENQVLFPGAYDASGNITTWTASSYYGNTSGAYQNLQIRPVPEPATYGAIFLGACLTLLGYRRFRQRRQVA